MMNKTKLTALVLVVVMCATMLASCDWFNKTPETPKKEYTYNSYSSALGSNWNPHTWETSADSSMAGYLEMPFVTMQIKDSKNGIYQWIYEMATSIEDVTAANQGDLTKYNVTLPTKLVQKLDENGNPIPVLDEEGNPALDEEGNPKYEMEKVDYLPSEVESGYVYEIKLNPNAKWQNGDIINADSYIYSMEKLLNSKMRNYRANLYISGESAVAGGLGYYNSEAPIYTELNGTEVDPSTVETFIGLSQTLSFCGYSIKDIYEMGYVKEETYNALKELANGYGYIPVVEENMEIIKQCMTEFLTPFGLGTPEAVEYYFDAFLFYVSGIGEKAEWESVGLYKVDDYTIRYVCQTAIELNYFLTSCTSTWLVHEATYEATLKNEGGLLITKYGTSAETSMSYGPYMMASFEDDKQVVYVQNPYWYGWEKDDEGNLVSYTPYLVDGEHRQRYQPTRVVIDVMTADVAYEAFLKGEIMDYAPTPEELTQYALSDRLTRVDETYTMSFFFNTNLEVLKLLDGEGGQNKNSIVLNNYNFRKAFSLAFDRADFVTVTEGYTPAYSLMNKLYHYDIYNDPTSSYRASEPAMQAICNLYGVKYGEGEIYKTLEEAYNSINGYNLTEAQALMKTACEELVADGLYTAGEEIKIQIAWKKGAMEDPDRAQVEKVQQYLNAAIEGSGFGKITIEGIGGLNDRYGDVPAGKFAIGYGAWGGAAFYPFRNMQVYCDTDQYDVNETGCWDPATTNLTLTVNGEEVTMTWKEWSNSMIGTGVYADADFETKLQITADMEEEYLKFFYRIPLCGTTICSLLSYKADYYTWDYNIMYGFGGLELMTYTYDDAAWAAYVASQGGTLNYK